MYGTYLAFSFALGGASTAEAHDCAELPDPALPCCEVSLSASTPTAYLDLFDDGMRVNGAVCDGVTVTGPPRAELDFEVTGFGAAQVTFSDKGNGAAADRFKLRTWDGWTVVRLPGVMNIIIDITAAGVTVPDGDKVDLQVEETGVRARRLVAPTWEVPEPVSQIIIDITGAGFTCEEGVCWEPN